MRITAASIISAESTIHLLASIPVGTIGQETPLAGGPGAIVEWFKGTALRPFLDPLDEQNRTAAARHEHSLAGVYPTLPDGSVLLPFPGCSSSPLAEVSEKEGPTERAAPSLGRIRPRRAYDRSRMT